jgi:hypothetical protein
MALGDGGHSALDPRPEVGGRFGAGDHVPPLLRLDLRRDGVALHHMAAEEAALPLAQVDLAEVG